MRFQFFDIVIFDCAIETCSVLVQSHKSQPPRGHYSLQTLPCMHNHQTLSSACPPHMRRRHYMDTRHAAATSAPGGPSAVLDTSAILLRASALEAWKALYPEEATRFSTSLFHAAHGRLASTASKSPPPLALPISLPTCSAASTLSPPPAPRPAASPSAD